MFIQLKNHKAHIYQHNVVDNSKADIFIIPGAGMDHRIGSMINLQDVYSHHSVYSIDLPGHGFTSGEVLHSVEELSDYTYDLIKAVGSKNSILIGHSMGGLICMELNARIDLGLSILMNTNYPLMVGEILLEYAKGNLDQASEFFTKYGVFNVPKTQIKTKTFGSMGSGFYGRDKGVIKSPYGTKNIESDPQREIDVYPLKKLFIQTQKEILLHDLKACSLYRSNSAEKLKKAEFIYGGKDKLARYNEDSEVHQSKNKANIHIMDDTGHFPYFERPDELSKLLTGIINTYI